MDRKPASSPYMRATGPQAAIFSYFKFTPDIHTLEKPFEVLINLPPAKETLSKFKRTNQTFVDCHVTVEDVRGRENDFSLDRNGVCWRTWTGPSKWHGLDAEGLKKQGHEWIRAEYLNEVEAFLKSELEKQDGTPIDFVKVFDYKLRSSKDLENFNKRTLDLDDGLDTMIPITHPHVDQSYNGAMTRLRVHMGEDASRLQKRRFRIVNVWRPLTTVTNWPLAVCDSATVQEQDLIASDLVRRKYVGETFYSTYNSTHRWYYLSSQIPDEVVMLKIFDSCEDEAVRYSLHSSFKITGVEDEDRESFEVRAFVFDLDE